MQPYRLLRPLILCLACSGTAAVADVTQVSPGLFECVARATRYDREDLAPFFADGPELSARIRLISDAPDAYWASSAGLMFELEGNRSVGVLVSTVPTDPAHIYVRSFNAGRAHPDLIAKFPRDAWVPVSVSYVGRDLTVTSGRFSKQMRVRRAAVVRRALHCQSGRFEIDVRR